MIKFEDLIAPFAPGEIEWRVQQADIGANGPWAKVVPYVDNRAIMYRLDSICGSENWRNEFKEIGAFMGENKAHAGFLCGISIRCDGEWVTKYDGANCTDIEAIKGGLSDSMKRAAVQWGIGRYLYDLEESWAICKDITKNTPGAKYQKAKSGGDFYWVPPALPAWALPGSPKQQAESTEVLRIRLFKMWNEKQTDPLFLERFTKTVVTDEVDPYKILVGSTFKTLSRDALKKIEEFLCDGVLPGEKK